MNAPRRTNLKTLHAVGAQHHADADFVGALRYGIGGDAVEADGGEDERDDAERARRGWLRRAPGRRKDRFALAWCGC